MRSCRRHFIYDLQYLREDDNKLAMKNKAPKSKSGKSSYSNPKEYHPQNSVGYIVNVAARLANSNLSDHIEDLGLNPAQIPLLFWLLEEDGITQKELCDRTHIEQPSVAFALANMEKKGLIVRGRSTDDRRKYKIYTSKSMKGLAVEIHKRALNSNKEVFSGFSVPTFS